MLHALDRLPLYLADLGLAATLLLLLIVLVLVLCRQPSWRRLWARAGLVSSLLLPVLVLINPGPRLDLGTLARRMIPPSDARPPTDDVSMPREAGPDAAATLAGGNRAESRLVWVRRVVALAYLVGSVGFLGWWLLGRWGVWFVTRHSVPPREVTALTYEALPFPSGLPRPRLRVTPRISRPVLAGFWRTTILIPPTFDRPGAESALGFSLNHELAHAASADPFFLWIGGLAQAFWYGLPPFWWIREQSRLDQEFLADRYAIGPRGLHAYATSLVDVAQEQARSVSRPSAPGQVTESSTLLLRILMLLKAPFPVENQVPWGGPLLVAGGTFAITVALSFLSFGARDDAPTWPVEASAPIPAFVLTRLDLPPAGDSISPFQLRYRLGVAFTLEVEVLCTEQELQDIRVLEHSLGTLENLANVLFDEPSWHRVRIVRRHGQESVWVDDVKVADHVPTRDRSSWITLRGLPRQLTRFHNLRVRPLLAPVDPPEDAP